MKPSSLSSFCLLIIVTAVLASSCVAGSMQADDLNAVLAKMNASSPSFKSAQADFEFETYQKVVDEKEIQKGQIHFRRNSKSVDAAFNITSPAPKQVVFKDNKIFMYEPKIDQLTIRDVSKNKADVEAFLSLGFGGSGDDLKKDYDVTLAGWEMIAGVKAAKLELVPKSERLRQTYHKIILWIDPEKDVLLKQQFLEASGDYRLAQYSNMKVNAKIPDDAFKTKTTGKTKTVQAQ